MAQTISSDRDDTVPRTDYVDQLLRADRLQQEVSRLTDELKKTKNELAHQIEEREIAERRAARAVFERNALLDEAA